MLCFRSIQVQYEEKEPAEKLQQALAEMQITVSVERLASARSCHSTKKKLFNDADAELTLKLLKITPKVEDLSV